MIGTRNKTGVGNGKSRSAVNRPGSVLHGVACCSVRSAPRQIDLSRSASAGSGPETGWSERHAAFVLHRVVGEPLKIPRFALTVGGVRWRAVACGAGIVRCQPDVKAVIRRINIIIISLAIT